MQILYEGYLMFNRSEETNKNEASVDLRKREFMGKFGKYAVVGAGMATLMTPTLSTANSYGRVPQGNNGWGNGDQAAPGGSLPHNQAENTIPAGTPANNDKHGVSDPDNIDPDEKPYK